MLWGSRTAWACLCNVMVLEEALMRGAAQVQPLSLYFRRGPSCIVTVGSFCVISAKSPQFGMLSPRQVVQIHASAAMPEGSPRKGLKGNALRGRPVRKQQLSAAVPASKQISKLSTDHASASLEVLEKPRIRCGLAQ